MHRTILAIVLAFATMGMASAEEVTFKRVQGWRIGLDRARQVVVLRMVFVDGTYRDLPIEREAIAPLTRQLLQAERLYRAAETKGAQ